MDKSTSRLDEIKPVRGCCRTDSDVCSATTVTVPRVADQMEVKRDDAQDLRSDNLVTLTISILLSGF